MPVKKRVFTLDHRPKRLKNVFFVVQTTGQKLLVQSGMHIHSGLYIPEKTILG